jgi:hypothetical protein
MKHQLVLLLFSVVACNQHQRNAVAAGQNDVKPFNETKNQNANIPPPSPVITPTPELNVAFGKGLRIVPKEIKLEDQKLRYKIDITYPQIEGAKNPRVLNLNRRIKSLVSEQYLWSLNPAKEDMRYYDKHPGIFNTVDLTYEVSLATDDLLSIYFEGYSYGIGAAHSVQHSFAVNYDLKNSKLLKLADIFKPNMNYLQFVSQYCMNDLMGRYGETIFKDALSPKAENYQSWNVTNEGIKINFDACSVLACSGGQQTTVIPFATLKEMLNPNNPVILLTK